MLFPLLLAAILSESPAERDPQSATPYEFPEKSIARNQSLSPRLTLIGTIILVVFGTAIVATIFFVLKPAFEEDIAPLVNQQ